MESGRFDRTALLIATIFLILGLAAPVLASPAPVSACQPCDEGFSISAGQHGLETEVRHSEAFVQVHDNGAATWTVRVVPTNESVLTRLAEERSLARSVAIDSYGERYGVSIDHEHISARVADGKFVMTYRTVDVVNPGPFGTSVLTYFRDNPGTWVYTDLGADKLTVQAPPGKTVARGFGDVSGERLTASELPEVQDGPFVVFIPEGSPTPGLLGELAVIGSLLGVLARNLVFFAALPGSILVVGFAGMRFYLDPNKDRNPARLGSLVAVAGALVIIGSLVTEADALSTASVNLLLGTSGGAVIGVLGAVVGLKPIRGHLSGLRLLGLALITGILAVLIQNVFIEAGSANETLAFGATILPLAVTLGWIDASGVDENPAQIDRNFLAFSAGMIGIVVVAAPLKALDASIFLLLLTAAAIGIVSISAPLYLLGAAGANAQST